MVAVRVIEVSDPHSRCDVSRFMGELDALLTQRLIGGGYILNREDDLTGAGNLATDFGRRLAEAQSDRTRIEKRETRNLTLNPEAQLVAIERQRSRHIVNPQHNNADLRDLKIRLFHSWSTSVNTDKW